MQNFLYITDNIFPFASISSSCVPLSIIRPCSITMIQSEFLTVDRRWAITNVVRPFIRASIPACTSFSVRVSIDDVASSRIRAGGSATAARAMASSCSLSLTQVRSVTGKHGVVAIRQPPDESVRIGKFCRPDTFFIRGIQLAISYIIHYSPGKQVGVREEPFPAIFSDPVS